MDWVIIVTVLLLLQYSWFGIQVGAVRGKQGLKAPAMTGAAAAGMFAEKSSA